MRDRSATTGFGGERAADFFALARPDRPRGASTRSARRTNYYPSMVPAVPAQFRAPAGRRRASRIGGRDWRCISGYGHAPEHIALYCDGAAAC